MANKAIDKLYQQLTTNFKDNATSLVQGDAIANFEETLAHIKVQQLDIVALPDVKAIRKVAGGETIIIIGGKIRPFPQEPSFPNVFKTHAIPADVYLTHGINEIGIIILFKPPSLKDIVELPSYFDPIKQLNKTSFLPSLSLEKQRLILTSFPLYYNHETDHFTDHNAFHEDTVFKLSVGLNFFAQHPNLKMAKDADILTSIQPLFNTLANKLVLSGNIYNNPRGILYLTEHLQPSAADTLYLPSSTNKLFSISKSTLSYISSAANVTATDAPDNNAAPESSIQFNTTLTIFATDEADNIEAEVYFNLPLGASKTVRLNAPLIEINGLKSFNKITAGASEKLWKSLPPKIQGLKDLKMEIQNLSFAFQTSPSIELSAFSTTVKFPNKGFKVSDINGADANDGTDGNPGSIFDSFSFIDPQSSFEFTFEGGKVASSQINMGGAIQIDLGKAENNPIISVMIGLGEEISFSGILTKGVFNLGDFIKKAMPKYQLSNKSLETLSVSALSLLSSRNRTTKVNSVAFDITIAGEWKPFQNDHLVLKQVKLHLQYQSVPKTRTLPRGEATGTAVTKPSTTGTLEAIMTIADIPVNIRAEKGQEGWLFTGKMEKIPQTTTKKLFESLSEQLFEGILPVPEVIQDMTITSIAFQFQTDPTNKKSTFTLNGLLPIGDQEAPFYIRVSKEKTITTGVPGGKTSAKTSFEGVLTVGYRHFNVTIEKEADHSMLVGSYVSEGNDPWYIKELVANLSTDIADLIPESLSLNLKDAFMVVYAPKSTVIPAAPTGNNAPVNPTAAPKKTFLLGADLSANFDLNQLPLVGSKLPADVHLGVDNLRLMVASAALNSTDKSQPLPAINRILEAQGVAAIPEAPNPIKNFDASGAKPSAIIGKGLNFNAKLNLGNIQFPILVFPSPPKFSGGTGKGSGKGSGVTPSGGGKQHHHPAGEPTAAPVVSPRPKPDHGATWIPIQRSVGPIHFERIGVKYAEGQLTFLLDAALSAGNMTLALQGLSAGSPIDHFAPNFNLDGIELDYASPNLEIGGALIKIDPVPKGTQYEYDGGLIIRAKKLTLTALGAYAKLENGDPSFFAYISVDYPLGGPAFFFVTGFSAGFGYNRELKIPNLKQIPQFPLVADALNGPPAKVAGQKDQDYLMSQVNRLKDWIPPAVGEYFITAGIKFSTFKIVNSLALLAVNFGRRMRIDLFGRSFLIHPPINPDDILGDSPGAANQLSSVPFLAKLEVDLLASYLPDDGIMEAKGAIKQGSYVYSPLAHIDGSFAFKSWFKGAHSGDFVFVLGGYHPKFKVPDYYPAKTFLKPLSIHYGINSNLYVKGSLYFALTPSVLMAGGALEAVFNSGPLHASFSAHADFLVHFKPFHYDISIGIDVHINFSFDALFVTVHVSLNAGANLHVWGPEFSGTAEVHFLSFSRTISFGNGPSAPPPITWQEFHASFLPADDKVLSMMCQGGLVHTDEVKSKEVVQQSVPEKQASIWQVNPKNFELAIQSEIPITKVTNIQPTGVHPIKTATFGIRPMHLTDEAISNTLTLNITKDGSPANNQFVASFSYKNQPSGMWGDYTQSALSKAIIKDLVSGIVLKPAQPPIATHSEKVLSLNLRYETETISDAFEWENMGGFEVATDSSTAETSILTGWQQAQEKQRNQLAGLVNPDLFAEISIPDPKAELAAWIHLPTCGTFD